MKQIVNNYTNLKIWYDQVSLSQSPTKVPQKRDNKGSPTPTQTRCDMDRFIPSQSPTKVPRKQNGATKALPALPRLIATWTPLAVALTLLLRLGFRN